MITEASNERTLPSSAVFLSENLSEKRFVNLKLKESLDDQGAFFLVDTGSDISIVKRDYVKGEVFCDTARRCKIKGVTSDYVETVALLKMTLDNGNLTEAITHSFQMVREDFPISCAGIVGQDFLVRFKCKLDFDKEVLELQLPSPIVFHLFSEPFAVLLPPRTEKVVDVPVQLPDGKDVICISKEINSDLYLGNTLSQIHKGTAKLCVANCSEEPLQLNLRQLSKNTVFHALEEYDVFPTSSWDNNISNRLKLLEDAFSLTHLNREERDSILNICRNFNDIFYLDGDRLSTISSDHHTITLIPNSKPIHVKPYRLPNAIKNEIENQVGEMLKEGIIEPSRSPWNSPLLAVPKKSTDGTKRWRVVVDYRKLNNITVDDIFPLPNISDILDQLGKCSYFSTIDLASGYHQIPLDPTDKPKTAFSTATGHYHFTRMPFGLKGAPATFQRIMNQILSGLNGLKCLVYLDDIVIYGVNLLDHNKKLIQVFECLRRHNLKINPGKCQFLRKEITYLGHIITSEGIKPDPSKLLAIKSFPVPIDKRQIKSFLGLTGYYRRFIKGYSNIAAPLTKLLKKNTPFTWNAFCEESFQKLKEALMNPPVLQYPDFSKVFYLTCDASDYAVGSVLSQNYDGADLPLAFASRVLNQAERNYSATEKELLAIVWSITHFRPYLFGKKFVVITDHKPLQWLCNLKDPTSRLMRWRIKLEEYDFKIEHKAGKYNLNADALSRIELPPTDINVLTRAQAKISSGNDTRSQSNHVESESTEHESLSHPNCSENINTTKDTNSDNEERKVLTDPNDINKIIKEFHLSPLGAHQGVYRTYKRIRSYFYFPRMFSVISDFISRCEHCQRNKVCKPTRVPMKITTTAKKPFQKIFLDIVGPLPLSHYGNKYILTMQDDLSKFITLVPLPNQESEVVAKGFVENFICLYGTPESIVTDQGTNFMSEIFKNVCKLLKITKLNTSAYHPQTNGALERSHRTIIEYVRTFTAADNSNWDAWLPYAAFSYNSTPHTSTDFMPYELIYGKKPNIPSSLTQSLEVQYNYEDYLCDLKYKLQSAFALARDKLISKKEKSKQIYDSKTNNVMFACNDLVLLKNEARKGKLDSFWTGPHEVTKIISHENTEIKIGKSKKVVHNNRLKHFHT